MAYRFVDFLQAAGQRIWQVLPVGPPGFGDSPYQCYSAFASYPLLISLELLRDAGLLRHDEIHNATHLNQARVNTDAVRVYKWPLLWRAAERLQPSEAYAQFCRESADWLEDYVLFMCLKEESGGQGWMNWERPLRLREARAMEEARQRLAQPMETRRRLEYLFAAQFQRLKRYANDRGVRLMGDMPIYVSHDSADVWSNPDQFDLDEERTPRFIAGTPPDYFSATGQLWGNPVYDWKRMQEDGFRWWLRRLEAAFEAFDLVRLDHFRGFEKYWAVPYGETTAKNGSWVPAPGEALFTAAEGHFSKKAGQTGELPIVAENLGLITPEVEQLRAKFGFPGMCVLLFAWGEGKPNLFQPHTYVRETVAYTGTHDNDTVVGWWQRSSDDREMMAHIERERDYVRRYFMTGGHDIHWTFIHAMLASVASTVILPLQDVLGLDNEARMNVPGLAEGNWSWRLLPDQLQQEHVRRLREMCELYSRLPEAQAN